MAVGTTAEHEDLRRTVRRWLQGHCPPEVPRATFEADPAELPKAFTEMAGQGWLGLHLAEVHGGEGFGLVELAVVAEELGRALLPGPLLPTLVASAALSLADEEGASIALGGLADGTEPAGVYFGPGALDGVAGDDGSLVVSGELAPVVGAPVARWL
ncbi:MAG: acyl-CoA dehydrogenase family protein, partial [Acidimicrobiales bacterium]